MPGLDAVLEVGKLLEDLPKLCIRANLAERRRILMSILEAVYVECKEEKSIVAIKPKPAFRSIFEIAETEARSERVLIKDEDHGKAPSLVDVTTENGMCLLWRRGRVERLLKHGFMIALAA